MKRVVVDHFGGPEVLRVVEEEDPRPSPGEVRVRVLAAGVSFTDATLSHGRKNWPAVIEWYASIGALWLWEKLSPRRVLAYQIQKFRGAAQKRPGAVGGEPRYPEWFREDFGMLIELLREGKIHPVVAERLPLSDARRAHELLERTAATGKLVLVP